MSENKLSQQVFSASVGIKILLFSINRLILLNVVYYKRVKAVFALITFHCRRFFPASIRGWIKSAHSLPFVAVCRSR